MNLIGLMLADKIYCDNSSGKYILSGVYHQIDIPHIPYELNFNLEAYSSFILKAGAVKVQFSIISESDRKIVTETDVLEISEEDSRKLIQLCMEFPIFSITTAGDYSLGLKLNGIIRQKTPFKIKIIEDASI